MIKYFITGFVSLALLILIVKTTIGAILIPIAVIIGSICIVGYYIQETIIKPIIEK